MAQFSTGLGLAVLGGCILGAAAISSHRLGGEAFAQGTGGERRVVAASIIDHCGQMVAYRIWSDNGIDLRNLGRFTRVSTACFNQSQNAYGTTTYPAFESGAMPPYGGNGWVCDSTNGLQLGWFTADNGTSGFRPLTDVDMSGETDSGDISQVLLDFNTRSDDLPPPPIDCTINSPR